MASALSRVIVSPADDVIGLAKTTEMSISPAKAVNLNLLFIFHLNNINFV